MIMNDANSLMQRLAETGKVTDQTLKTVTALWVAVAV